MYTGGTTGFPKGVPGNHMGEVSYIRDIMDDVIDGRMTGGKEVVLMVNPLFHIMAKGFTIAFGFNLGNTVVLMPSPEVDATLKAIERYKVGWMLGVPALYRMFLENDRLDQYDLSSLKYCYCGGDVLPAEVFKTWKEKYGVPIYQVYGSTEVGHITYSLLDKEPKPTVVGTPLKSRKCILADQETLEPVSRRRSGRAPGHLPLHDEELLEQTGGDEPLLRRARRRHLLQHGRLHEDERRRGPGIHGEDGRYHQVQGLQDIGLRDRSRPPGPPHGHRGLLSSASPTRGSESGSRPSWCSRKTRKAWEAPSSRSGAGTASRLQDSPLHRIPRHAAQVEGRQAPPKRNQGRREKKAGKRSAKTCEVSPPINPHRESSARDTLITRGSRPSTRPLRSGFG